MKAFYLFFICILCTFNVVAQNQFKLTGTIKNQADWEVVGMICELKESGHVDTTDSSGAFNVTGDATPIAFKI